MAGMRGQAGVELVEIPAIDDEFVLIDGEFALPRDQGVGELGLDDDAPLRRGIVQCHIGFHDGQISDLRKRSSSRQRAGRPVEDPGPPLHPVADRV